MRGAAQQVAGEPAGRMTPLGELVNTLEFEAMARRKLAAEVFALIAGSERAEMERYTFRPRLMVDTAGLDLSTELLGVKMFTPVAVGPASDLRRFHAEGTLAVVRGAGAAKALTVVSSESSFALEKIAAEAKGPLWIQVYSDAKPNEAWRGAGFKAMVITARDPRRIDWRAIERVRRGVSVPVVLKGVARAADAMEAVRRGMQGVVVSGLAELAPVADAVGGRGAVMVDGGFRRGTDVLKALILGAQAVLVTRPVVWGLAGYGAEGVQAVVEMLQTELARNMIMIGAAGADGLRREMVRRHAVNIGS